MSVVILLIGLCSHQKIVCSTSVTQSIASDRLCVICELCAVLPDPAVYRQSRNMRAIDRDAFRDTLCMSVSPELCPSIENLNSTLQSVLEKYDNDDDDDEDLWSADRSMLQQHAPLCRRKVRADRL